MGLCYKHPKFIDVAFVLEAEPKDLENNYVLLKVFWWRITGEKPYPIGPEDLKIKVDKWNEFVAINVKGVY